MSRQCDKLKVDLAALATMSPAQLREHWIAVTKKPLPRISPTMLRLALAYELQAKALGGLSRAAQQRLDQAAAAKTQTRGASPGMRLVREYNGQLHIVTIGENGEVEWSGRSWRSLSEVARAITGTRWSGPAFFGLKERKRIAASRRSAAPSTPASRVRKASSRTSTRSTPSARRVPPTC